MHKQNISVASYFFVWGILILISSTFTSYYFSNLKNSPIVISHRGASAIAPEETQAAYDTALLYKTDFLELDLHRTKDNVIILNHDPTLNRTTNIESILGVSYSTYVINEMLFSDLKKIDAGSYFSSRFTGEPILTFEKFLNLYCGVRKLYIELKYPDMYPGIEQQVVSILASKKCLSSVVFQSFSISSLINLKQLAPHNSIALLCCERLEEFNSSKRSYVHILSTAKDIGVDIIAIRGDYFGREWYRLPDIVFKWTQFIAAAKQENIKIHIWTLNSKLEIFFFRMLGIAGYFSDHSEYFY